MKNGIFGYITDSDCRFRVNAAHGFYKSMPDDVYLRRYYKARTGRELDLDHPKTFNEKLQWLKINDHNPLYITLVDKYEVKDYVAERIGSNHIIPTYGVWDRFEDINFEELPDKFVLKTTHDSGSVVICKDKNQFDKKSARKKLNRSLKRNYYYKMREWPYKSVKSRIIAEKFMVDESGFELKDYKVLCFNGEPKLIELHQGRFTDVHYQDFYDTNWQKTTICNIHEQQHPEVAPRPICLEEMLEYSRILSANIPHVRVDWYVINELLYFGEMTFYDASGFDLYKDDKDDLLLGSWITIV